MDCPYLEICEMENNYTKKMEEVACCWVIMRKTKYFNENELCFCEGDQSKCDDPGRLARDEEK
jgi:hypothetical protein